jgi:hypothetical protein
MRRLRNLIINNWSSLAYEPAFQAPPEGQASITISLRG